MAGILGSLKWSCLPFFALSGLTYILISKDKKLHRTIWVSVSLLIPFLFLIPFGKNSYEYLMLVRNWESQMTPGGLSLALIFPRYISKVVPFLLSLVAAWIIRNWKGQNYVFKSATEILIWGGFGMVGAAFGTVSVEYKLICMLFLIPFILSRQLIFFNENLPKINRLSLIFGASILAYALRFTLNLHFIDKIIGDRREIIPLIISITGLLVLDLCAGPRSPATGGTNREEA